MLTDCTTGPDNGGNNRARTCDPMLVRHVLSQLSYAPQGCPSKYPLWFGAQTSQRRVLLYTAPPTLSSAFFQFFPIKSFLPQNTALCRHFQKKSKFQQQFLNFLRAELIIGVAELTADVDRLSRSGDLLQLPFSKADEGPPSPCSRRNSSGRKPLWSPKTPVPSRDKLPTESPRGACPPPHMGGGACGIPASKALMTVSGAFGSS